MSDASHSSGEQFPLASASSVPRTLEPELMDTAADAELYDAMDHAEVNRNFVSDFINLAPGWATQLPAPPRIIDLGSGTARIPIELCQQLPGAQVVAVDAALHMQRIAQQNVAAANLADCISLSTCDVKTLSEFPDASFDAVISNTLLHHLADPEVVLRQALRVLKPMTGRLFIRDLLRPETAAEIDRLTALYAGQEIEQSRELLRQSLHAALTLQEARAMVANCGLDPQRLQPTSDRHWTLA